MYPRFIVVLIGLLMLTQPLIGLAEAANPATDPNLYRSVITPTISSEGMVVTQDRLGSIVGAEILAQGGNAVDATVAVAFAMAVVHPTAGNIGGGGFMLVHLADENRTIAIDYRETAPSAAFRDMFLDDTGNVDTDKVRFSHASAGVPGTVMGMHHALTNYGSMSWQEVIAPAIKLAGEGFLVPYEFAAELRAYSKRLHRSQASREIFYKENDEPYDAGELFVQKDLARTLGVISNEGPDGFYKGEIADLIVAEMERGNGIITYEDLANYKVREREVAQNTYRGLDIISMPPPSSGGVHIVQMLNILENFDIASMGARSAQSYHLMAEVMRLAYADRAVHLGDPDYYDVPVKWITSKSYASELAGQINMHKARPSSEVKAGVPTPYDSPDTTHFSIADKFGNVVSNTYTLNLGFGSGLTVAGTGVLLNDEMDDFSSKAGAMNAYMLIGSEANSIEAGKVPLSSMSPTIVLKDGKPILITGGGGGSRIISATLQTIINVVDFNMNVAEASYTPRIHHQWKPDILFYEEGVSPDTLRLLRAKGHTLKKMSFLARNTAVAIGNDVFSGVADPRRVGGAAIAPDQIN